MPYHYLHLLAILIGVSAQAQVDPFAAPLADSPIPFGDTNTHVMKADPILEIPIFLNERLPAEQSHEGLLVEIDEIALVDDVLTFRIMVWNYQRQEIFLEIPAPGDISCSQYWGQGGGISFKRSSVAWPDNTHTLRRLHAASKSKDGGLDVCGCAMLSFPGELEEYHEGARVEVSFTLHGYYRSNGEKFEGRVELTIPAETIAEALTPSVE